MKTIKCALTSVLRNKEEAKPIIETLVQKCNNIMVEAFMFTRAFILHKFDHTDPECLPKFDQTFFRYAVSSVVDVSERKKKSILFSEMRTFYQGHYPRGPQEDANKLAEILHELADEIRIAMENNIWMYFQARLRHFIRRSIHLKDPDANRHKAEIFALIRAFETPGIVPAPEIYQEFYDTFREYILPLTWEKSLNYNAKKDPRTFLFYLLRMTTILENEGIKTWQVLPLRTELIPKHIPITTSIITTALSNLVLPRAKEQTGDLSLNTTKLLKVNKEVVWNSLLNLNAKVFKKRKDFAYYVRTDGVSISLTFGKSSESAQEKIFEHSDELTPNQIVHLRNAELIGCDPGNANILFLYSGKTDKKLVYTKRQRHSECGFISYKKFELRQRNKRLLSGKTIEERMTELSTENSQTVDLERFLRYVQAKRLFNQEVSSMYNRAIFRKKKFDIHRRTQRSEDNLNNRIKETFQNGDKKIVIGYGDWSVGSQNTLRHSSPSPKIGIRRKLNFQSITVSERYTSKTCPYCHNILTPTPGKDGKCHRLLCCSTCQTITKQGETKNLVINRDLVGAKNIWKRFYDHVCPKVRLNIVP